MLEHLLNYVDTLEKQLIDKSSGRTKYNAEYQILIKMKKLILEDMLPYFIERDIEGIRGYMPENFMVQIERRKWLKLCTKYKEYVDVKLIMDYFDKEVQNKYEQSKKQRESRISKLSTDN